MCTSGPVPLLYLIKELELAVRSRLEQVTRTAKLTVIQYTALTSLERHPGISSAQLARNSFVRAQTMAEMVIGLIDRGLISRHRDPDNRRHYQLQLTPDGLTMIETLRPLVHYIEEAMLLGLDQAEAEALRSYLGSCRRSVMSMGIRSGRSSEGIDRLPRDQPCAQPRLSDVPPA